LPQIFGYDYYFLAAPAEMHLLIISDAGVVSYWLDRSLCRTRLLIFWPQCTLQAKAELCMWTCEMRDEEFWTTQRGRSTGKEI